MIVTTKLSMDLTKNTTQQTVDVMQDDKYSRDIRILLHADGQALELQQVTGVQIRYQKPDGMCGLYDTLPDGSCAWSIAENVLTIRLAPQTCTTPGTVLMTVSLLQGQAQLSCFALRLRVQALQKEGLHSENYIHLKTFLPHPAEAEEGHYIRIREVDGTGRVTALETVDAPPSGILWRGEWDAGQIYEYRDCVRYRNNLYFRLEDGTGGCVTLAPDEDASWERIVADGTYTLPVAAAQVLGGVMPVSASESMSQPVGVTAEGRLVTAPAGFGLGSTNGCIKTFAQLDTTRENGWYALWSGGTLANVTFNAAILFVNALDINSVVQTLYPIGLSGTRLTRMSNVNGWLPWEAENPPMLAGVEYRTTERWNGKAVYCKLVDCGAAENGKEVAHGITASRFIRYSASIADIVLPVDVNENYNASIQVLSANVIIRETGYDGFPVYAVLYYTRE